MRQRLSLSLVRKLLRYAAVSGVATSVSLTILGVLVATGATTAGWANVIATAVGTVPSFELNRRWVWGKSGRRSLRAEMGPFCVLSFTGLALSTLAVSATSRWAAATGLGVGARTLVAEVANVATFGTLWVAQYLILDRILFRARAASVGSAAGPALVPDPAGAAARRAGDGGRLGLRQAA